MAGTTSSIISNLLSSLERLPQFMPTFSSLATSSSSSIAQEDVTAAEVNSIQKRLMEDLSRLSRMLQRIQAVLHDVEEREVYDKAIQLWLNELREVAYDAEDVLDQYDYQVIKTQLEGMIAVTEEEPSLKKKPVDNDDIYGYQHRNFIGEDSDLNLIQRRGWRHYFKKDSDDSSSDEDSDDSSSTKGMAAPSQASLLLQKQLEDLGRNPVDVFSAGLVDDSNIFEWSVTVFGPPDTLYDGGYFKAIMSFPLNYPNSPPTFRFTSKMWHPNVYPDGRVCISILHAPGENPNGYELTSERWTPVHNNKF